MLKLNYTDCGLFLEQVDASLDEIAAQRVMLAVYAGEPLHMEPGRAAFLVPASAPEVQKLKRVLQADATQTVTVAAVDDGFVEVSLKGTWIAKSINAEAGTLVAALSDECEKLVCQLWQVTQWQSAITA
ncbi:MAG: hypothetical protein DCF25_20535 [Leptolyngbya foveolarum]|uniref:Uncharacterized protein n=1 Tax=Leptolyngbya foveolarum TaxID=47253 RepID=A0A2W4TSK6_9CYAN|nr:MAG: hypothetical protein DCF25_20535 [Leptolyngbya foveolarum]